MNTERQKQILELLLKHERITVKELSERVFASQSSIRRDLIGLEEQNLIKRTHGTAEVVRGSAYENIPFVIRELEQAKAKEILAMKAAKRVNDNDVIFMDGSSSVYNMIPLLAKKKNLTVITNGIRTALRLSEYRIKTVSTGGDIVPECLVMVGSRAYDTVMSINANSAFFSCRGISSDGWATDISVEENAVRQKMMAQSEHSYLLCASDKFGHKYCHNLIHTENVTEVISELDDNKFGKE